MGLLSGVSDLLFGSPDTGKADASYAKASALAEKAGLIFEDLDAPTQQQLLDSVKYLEDVPYQQAEQLGPSQMQSLAISPNEQLVEGQRQALNQLLTQGKVEADPELAAQQKMALAQLSKVGEEGMSARDLMEREQLMRSLGAQEQSRQKSILQSMAERGSGSSGIEAALRGQSSQSSANRGLQEGLALAAAKEARKLEGMQAAGGLAGQLRAQDVGEQQAAEQQRLARAQAAGNLASQQRGQEFGEQFQLGSAKASAADQIAQFNALQRAQAQQANLAQQRGIAAQKAGTLQQAFQNEMEKRKAQAAAYTSASQQAGNQAAGQQQSALQQWSAGPQLFSTVVQGAATAAGKAEGGIIEEGGKGYGDDVLVPVNEDEIVLNRRQQANLAGKDELLNQEEQKMLFEMINKNGAGPKDIGEEYSKIGENYADFKSNEDLNQPQFDNMTLTVLANQVKQAEEAKDLRSRVEQLEALLSAFRGNKR